MSAQYVPLPDLQERYGAVLPDQAQADILLGDAELEVRQALRRAGRDLDADVASGVLSTAVLSRVVCEMVATVLRNPTGARSGTTAETTGPFTRSESFTLAEHARGELGLTDHQKELLGLQAGGAFTIRQRARPHCPDVDRVWR